MKIKHLSAGITSILFAFAWGLGAYQLLPVQSLSGKTLLLTLACALIGGGCGVLLHTFLRKQTFCSKRNLVLCAVAATVLAAGIVPLFHLSFPEKEILLPQRSIKIGTTDGEVIFNSIHNGYRGIPFSAFKQSGDWQRNNENLVHSGGGSATLETRSAVAQQTAVFFTKSPLSKTVNIDWGDGSQESVNLTEPVDTPFQITHTYDSSVRWAEIVNFILNLYPVWLLCAFNFFVYLLALLYFLKKRTLKFIIAFVIISIAALFMRIFNSYDFPLGWDEGTYSRAAMRYADSFLTGKYLEIPNQNYNFEHPAFIKLSFTLPVLMDGRAQYERIGFSDWNKSELGKEDYTIFTGRLVSALFSVVLIQALCFLIHPAAGFFLLIHSLAAEFGAQARLEAIPMLTSFLSIWFFTKGIKLFEDSRQRLKYFGLSAVFLGITAASKFIYCSIVFAMLIFLIPYVLKNKNIFKKILATMVLFGMTALTAFYVFNPSVWVNPVAKITRMFSYHDSFSTQWSYAYPAYQPIIWITRSAAHHPDTFEKSPLGRAPEHFFFSCDELIFLLAALGVARLVRKNPIYLYWFICGLIFMFLWKTKWYQYACILIVPLCISASYGLRIVSTWVLGKENIKQYNE